MTPIDTRKNKIYSFLYINLTKKYRIRTANIKTFCIFNIYSKNPDTKIKIILLNINVSKINIIVNVNIKNSFNGKLEYKKIEGRNK